MEGVMQTFSERSAVKFPTRMDYHRRLIEFKDWCRMNFQAVDTVPALDNALITMFDEMFFKGRPVADARKLAAAVKHVAALLHVGRPSELPRAKIALRGWGRLAPEAQRLPFPLVALAAVAGLLIYTGHGAVAQLLFCQFKTYLRPGVCDALRVGQLVWPSLATGLAV